MRKLAGLTVMAVVLAWALPVWADCCAHGGQCPMNRSSSMKADSDETMCPITNKLLEKAAFFLDNADALGLSDEQVRTIKSLKLDAKKGAVRQDAEMKVFAMDMKAKMSEATLDVEGLNAMIDGAAAGMISGSKAGIAAYAKLRGVLSDEQMAKAKELHRKQR